MFRRLFIDHPRSVGESYGQHAGFALGVGLRMIGAGLACVLHGVFPFLFVKTGSKCISELNECLQDRQPGASATAPLNTATTFRT
jgi:hypothetical protein